MKAEVTMVKMYTTCCHPAEEQAWRRRIGGGSWRTGLGLVMVGVDRAGEGIRVRVRLRVRPRSGV